MKDFNTGKEIDMQGMLDMLRYAEEAKEFNMRSWIQIKPCGTAGCLVGTYIINTTTMSSEIDLLRKAEAFFNSHCFELSLREKRFLFTIAHLDEQKVDDAMYLTKEQAIARLRKFIYYKLRKAELLEDYQASRRIEGDNLFVKQKSQPRLLKSYVTTVS